MELTCENFSFLPGAARTLVEHVIGATLLLVSSAVTCAVLLGRVEASSGERDALVLDGGEGGLLESHAKVRHRLAVVLVEILKSQR